MTGKSSRKDNKIDRESRFVARPEEMRFVTPQEARAFVEKREAAHERTRKQVSEDNGE